MLSAGLLIDLGVSGLSPSVGRNLFNCQLGAIAHSLLLSASYCPDITEILLKRKENCKSSIHPIVNRWMDDLLFYILFNSISVIPGHCLDDNEWL